MSFLELSNDYYWIAARYQESNNRWEWATVEPFQPNDYSNWFLGEPSNNAPGSFVYMNYIFDNGVWFDEVSTPRLIRMRINGRSVSHNIFYRWQWPRVARNLQSNQT
ncbi:hypothetical protein DAPPUDRAFT_240630 [Daphnia pulex]|uniref:C-type lectin domain-containing protein n=1 Tax=Daphnia pulex TaxID=6669 RepID=E9GC01_DAPPU|nr:hypothetical protein DAPPUDRAFT_240630 [Daphnia pulex]|eukprot:EFX83048.1 hypothetical protein DAPPUDRAFT_240630 [Daphnia pulex]